MFGAFFRYRSRLLFLDFVGVKTFNGCHWKGAKIRVATAHEYYLDKLETEKQTPPKPIQRTFFSPPKLFNEGSILKVKRRKNEHVYIGTGPIASLSQPRDILPTGKRRKFNDDGEYLEPLGIPIAKEETPKPLTLPVETPLVVSAPSARKGLRIGFGSIAALPPRAPPSHAPIALHASPCDTCVENEINIPESDNKGRYGFDEGAKILTESGQYDELSSSDGEDCLSPEELTEQSFNSERERQKRICSFIQENVATSQSGGERMGPEDAQEDIEPVPIIEQTKISPFRSAVWSQPTLRFDPTVHRKSQKFHLTPEEVQERDKILLQKRELAEAVDPSTAVADLEKLKGIFHREGGFSWDATGKGLVARDANSSTDKVDDLTLEAERYGFDVCEEETRAAASSEQKEKKESGNSMLFGFFEGAEQASDLESGDESEGLEDDNSSDGSSDDGSDIFNENEENESDSDSNVATKKLTSWRQQHHEEDDHEFHYPSFEEVVATATKFKRDL
jgi:hypothetical protein